MKISKPSRRAGMLGAVAMAGLVMTGAPMASAAPSGNLETKGPQYYCENGSPQLVVFVKAADKAEQVSYTSNRGKGVLGELVPNQRYGMVFSHSSDWKGTKLDITFTGATSKSSVTVNAKVPTTCAGLSEGRPASGWKGTAVAPQPATSSSTSDDDTATGSSSGTATGGGSDSSSTGAESSTAGNGGASSSTGGGSGEGEEVAGLAPGAAGGTAVPSAVTGPVVQTDFAGQSQGTSNTATMALLGLFGAGAAVTAGAAMRRLGDR